MSARAIVVAMLFLLVTGCQEKKEKQKQPVIEGRRKVVDVKTSQDGLIVTFRRCVYFDNVLRFEYGEDVEIMPFYTQGQ